MGPEGDRSVPGGLARLAQHLEAKGRPDWDRWARQLPNVLQTLLDEWRLEPEGVFELSYNFVVAVLQADGAEAVLKICLPDPDVAREAAALKLYDGQGACRLLRVDAPRRAMLLERIRPGEMLLEIARSDDDAATRIGARAMQTLWREPSARARFRPIAEWFRAFARHRAAFDGGSGPIAESLLTCAEQLAADLLGTAPRMVVLHGDFHHNNVLSSDRAGWLAIDPKGMLGDPGYEAGPFLCNPWPVTTDVLERRLNILSEELAYDRERLRQWGIAHAVLSAVWSVSSQSSGADALLTAQRLMELE